MFWIWKGVSTKGNITYQGCLAFYWIMSQDEERQKENKVR